jgi:DNA-binding NarL/FixJ family response regulator
VGSDIVAFVDDLMDRSRLSGALPGTRFVRDVDAAMPADVAIVDLARHADAVRALRAHSASLRIVCFGPHVDDAAIDRAEREGADAVMPRSRFFRDPAAAISA